MEETTEEFTVVNLVATVNSINFCEISNCVYCYYQVVYYLTVVIFNNCIECQSYVHPINSVCEKRVKCDQFSLTSEHSHLH